MKFPHLIMIFLIVLTLETIPSYAQYSATGPFPGFITVQSDKSTYNYGNTINITGNVTKYGTVTIEIFDPFNQPVTHSEVEPHYGHFAQSYLILGPLWRTPGTYTVIVKQDTFSYQKTTFYFTGGGPSRVIGVSSTQAPVVITQTEFYGPWTHHKYSCIGDGDVSANQWFELYNQTPYEVHIQGYSLHTTSQGGFGGTEISSESWIDLKPHQKCTFALMGAGQAYIPDPRNVVISFGYNYSANSYNVTTPMLTDTYNDSRTWNFVNNNWSLFAPSPLEQVSSGVSFDDITCNKNLKMMIYQNKTSCIALNHVARMTSYGWKLYEKQEYIPVFDRVYSSGPGYGCPFIFPSAKILNSSGFGTYNYSGTRHYVLEPGHAGTFVYDIYGISYNLDPPISSPGKINVTNGADIYFQSSGHSDLARNDSSTIVTQFSPPSEIIESDKYVTVVATISANSDAQKGTYWVNLFPGGCSQLPQFPVVIGSKTDATDVQ